MTTAAKKVLEEALRLDPVERATLIDRLFHSFDSAPDYASDAAWAREVESRIDAYERGELGAVDAATVFARIAQKK